MRNIRISLRIILTMLLTTVLAFVGLLWGLDIKGHEAKAATKVAETVNIRIIGTTDMHGQLNSKDYEQGVDYENGGLARVINLIQKTRSEVPEETVITLDAGDTLFDYTTEYIFSENQNALQPIYQAMAKVGYDAITLGNHDFDYGYDYILRQLDGSGLRNITVVSNVTDSKTGDYPFLENMLITRTVTTSAGNKIDVKIGIIGQTIPTLTGKTHSYTGILKSEDIVANATTQAEKLREMGADIIIALSHTGMGTQTPELNDKNAAYALTKIPDIDVVVCGHEHNLFPTTDKTSTYFTLPNVDKETYLMNGKNVIMAGNRGSAIGVVDLTLKVYKDSIGITNRKSEIRKVKDSAVEENKTLTSFYGDWEEKLLNYSTDVLAKLDAGSTIHNFYGMLGDNAAIQLLNDAKINYAKRFVHTTGKDYQEYPIIAASTYMSYGASSAENFINIHDSITEANLSSIQPYNNYLYVYTISGKQLKEWLEWSASAYETTGIAAPWKSGTMSELMKKTDLRSFIQEDWLNNWSNFYIFDGIDYVIDPYQAPRYDISGNRISLNKRVSSVTYNGTPVADDMEFLLVTNKITKPTNANSGVEKQVVLNGFNRTQSILSKYIKQISSNDSIIPQIDYNWRVKLPEGTRFIVKVPAYAGDLFQKTSWYKQYLQKDGEYNYYVASYPKQEEDKTSPHIIITPAVTNATASPYEIAVNVSDASELKLVKYLIGNFNAKHDGWVSANNLDNNQSFRVNENGIYSVYAEDIYGNKSVYNLKVDNFNEHMLGSPTINKYTNRKSAISGTGEPNAKVVIEAYTGTYESKVSGKGVFSYAMPSQPSGSTVTVHIVDKSRGLESERVSATVKRTGPNQPEVNPLNNTACYLTGDVNDDDSTIVVIVDNIVYVSDEGGKELFEKNIEIYDASLKIVETKLEIDSTGYFTMILPAQEAGKTVKVYGMDHLSRNSRMNSLTVRDVAPNAPVVYEISNIEKSLRGYVPTTVKKTYNVTIQLGDQTYLKKTDKSGAFSIEFNEQLYAGQIIKIMASDEKNGMIRNSFMSEVTVADIEDYVKTTSASLTVNNLTDKSYEIAGEYLDMGTVYIAVTTGEEKEFSNILYELTTDAAGRYSYWLNENLKEGMTVYAMVRFTDGEILLANKSTVLPGKPDAPSLIKEITNADKTVQVAAKKDCGVTLKIGSKTYLSSKYTYDKIAKQYIYNFSIDRAVSGTAVTVNAANIAGTSDSFKSVVIKTAPDQPMVSMVKEGDKLVSGKVELLDYTIPEQLSEVNIPKIPERFNNADPMVAKTQTQIYAQIGKKIYEGSINNEGKFTIEIPAQAEGTVIKVWGSNKAGRGPLIKLTVVK